MSMLTMCLPLQNMDPYCLEKTAIVVFDRDTPDVTEGKCVAIAPLRFVCLAHAMLVIR